MRSALAQDPALVFAQELHQRGLVESMAAEHGSRVVWPARVEPRWWMVSWLMVRGDLDVEPLAPAEQELLVPFDSYVAGARISGPALQGVSVLSVHASPSAVTAEDLARWPRELPEAREGGKGVRDAGRLFYADLLVAALRELSANGPVLAAGDLNEAREWDTRHPGHTWGHEFFTEVVDAGLVDVTWRLWGEERRTRFHPREPGYQLDRVLATPDVATLVARAHVDPVWETSDGLSEHSDHAPVWFELSQPTASTPGQVD